MATREDQIATANARYTKIKNELRSLKSVIKTKNANNEDTTEEKEKMKELINSLKNTVNVLNQLRQPPGSKGNDKEPVNFILDIISSSFEGLMSTSLGPLELLIQLVDFFVRLFVSVVKTVVDTVKRFVYSILNQIKTLFPQIDILYDAISTIDINNETVQNLWYNIVELVHLSLGSLQNIFYSFSEFFYKIIKEITDKIKILIETLFSEIKTLFPQIDILYGAVRTVEETSKINQSIWYYIVDVITTIISALMTIFNGVLSIFIGKVGLLDDNIKFFNDQVNALLGLARLNNEIVNGTKAKFNETVTKLKTDLTTLRNHINGKSGNTIKLGPFGSVKGPSFDLTPLNTAINSLKTIP